MNELNPSSPPSSSGARIGGDDLQHLVAWYWCVKMLMPTSGIANVCVEADVKGNLDDVTVGYHDGRRNYYQVKSSVSAKGRVNDEWLRSQANPRVPSLVQKLYRSWIDLGRPAGGVGLITSRPIDPDDAILSQLDRGNKIGTALRRTSTARGSSWRSSMAEHVACSEADLCEFFDALEIRSSQTEAEWRTHVTDVAMGAGVSFDETSILAAIGWVREWVKETRDPRDLTRVAGDVVKLGIRAEEPRNLVVIHGIDVVPDDGCVESLSWIHRFRGDEPEVRRGLINTDDWNAVLKPELNAMKNRLIGRGQQRVLLRGALRLPSWFAVGATLREVAEFNIAMDYRGEVWVANAKGLPIPAVEIRRDELLGVGRTVLVLAISTDDTETVREQVVDENAGRLVTLAPIGGPSRRSLDGPSEAMALAVAVRDWVRANVRGADIDLVLMAPAPFALFLGHLWDRIAPTTVHEDLVSEYQAAFRFSNLPD